MDIWSFSCWARKKIFWRILPLQKSAWTRKTLFITSSFVLDAYRSGRTRGQRSSSSDLDTSDDRSAEFARSHGFFTAGSSWNTRFCQTWHSHLTTPAHAQLTLSRHWSKHVIVVNLTGKVFDNYRPDHYFISLVFQWNIKHIINDFSSDLYSHFGFLRPSSHLLLSVCGEK